MISAIKVIRRFDSFFSADRTVQIAAVCLLSIGMTGCQTSNVETKLTDKAIEQARKVDNQLQKHGAVIVTRITNRGKNCPIAEVRLRPVHNGVIDRSVFYTIGQTRSVSGQSHLAAMSTMMWHASTLQLKSVMDATFPKDGSTSFVPVPPGDYAVTSAICDYGNGAMARLGADHPTIITQGTGVVGAVPGANLIRIRQGDILDAGILDIQENGTAPGLIFDQKLGKLVAHPVPASFRQLMKSELPDLYKRMRFTTFSSGKFKQTP